MSPARKWMVLAVAVALAQGLCVAGCAERPAERLANHIEAMVVLLEQHHADPERAADAVTRYVEENREALIAIRRALDERRAGLSGDALADLAGQVLKDIGPVMERADRLMRAYPQLAENDQLLRAFEPLRAAP